MPFVASAVCFGLKKADTAQLSALPYYQVSSSDWTNYWSNYITTLNAANSSATMSISTIAIGSGGSTFNGQVMGPNGIIYGIPYNSASVWYINPSNDTFGSFGTGLGGATYGGGALGADGNIYCTPGTTGNFLVIYPATNTIATFTPATSGGWTNVSGGWVGAVLAPNGKIYCPPALVAATTPFCIIPGASPTACNVPLGSSPSLGTAASNGFWGGCLAPNGYIYFLPQTGSNVCKFNPANETWTLISVTANGNTLGITNGNLRGAILHPSGIIFGVDNFAGTNPTRQFTFNTNTDLPTTFLLSSGSLGGWLGGCLGPDGKIYLCLYNSGQPAFTSLTVNSPVTATTSSNFGSYSGVKWRGFIMATTGNLYAFSYGNGTVEKITFSGLSQLPTSNWCLSSWTNRSF